MFILWVASIIITIFVALEKNRSVVGWFFLSLFLGPVALILVILASKAERKPMREPNQYREISLNSIRAELEELRKDFAAFNSKLSDLGAKIGWLEKNGVGQQVSEPPLDAVGQAYIKQEKQEKTDKLEPAVAMPKKQPMASRTDIEMDLGKFWLNKIGMVVFSLGVAFLLAYTLTRIAPVAKIILGYSIAAVLLVAGIKLERIKKFINYGRVLLGGGWAIIYFTTYAMYHFEASKIINSQLLDLLLLAIVSLGIIVHSLRYKSEALTAITLFIGYFTSVLGDVGNFTLISAALLAAVALVAVYKMQWVRFIFLGIILTYLTHFVWVIKQISFSLVPASSMNVENVYFLFDIGFLSIYWALFTLAAHLMRNKTAAMSYKRIAAANFTNFILFFFMAYPKLYLFYPAYKFNAVLGFGLAYLIVAVIMDIIKRREIFISDIIIAISLLTLSIPLKFLPYYTTLIWFIELPFLLFIGFIFERKVYRYLGFALAVVLFLKFIFWDWHHLSENLEIFSTAISWQGFLSFVGFISAAICFVLYRSLKPSEDNPNSERLLQNFYSGFSVAYLTMYMWEVVKPLWLTLGLSCESLLIFAAGALLLDKYIRWYALTILVLAGIRFCFYDKYVGISELQQLFLTYGPIVCAFAEYCVYRRLNRNSLVQGPEVWLAKLLFFAAASLLVFAIVVYVQHLWVTLSLAILAILALLWGVKISDKYIRIYALLVLLFAFVRFAFVDDYYGYSKLFQWMLICVKLALAYSAYFIYRNMDKKSRIDESDNFIVSLLFYASSFLVVWSIFKYIRDIWVTLSLGLAGVSLFIIGFLIKDKIFRHGGFIIFGITLVRVLFVDLSGLAMIYKIISFIILGVLFLGVSFIYTKRTTSNT